MKLTYVGTLSATWVIFDVNLQWGVTANTKLEANAIHG